MPLPTYPLAVGTVPVRATDVAQAMAWRLLRPGTIPVTLGLAADAWLVNGPHGFLGLIDAPTTTRYPDMLRVFRSGCAAGTTGRLDARVDGSGAFDLTLFLPAAPVLVPVGSLGSTVELLDQGARLDLDLSVEFATACQVLVELDAVGSRVVALYDGKLAGGIVDTPPSLLAAVRSRRLAARAFVVGPDAALDVSNDLTARAIPALRVPDPPVIVAGGPTVDQDVVVDAAEAGLEPFGKHC